MPTPPAHSSDTDDTSASDDPDRDSPRCPVCGVPLAGFVKNFEALAALESSAAAADNVDSTAPDLTAVVAGDLVIDRSEIDFVRTPSNELGKGASAVVYKGHYNGNDVAVKCIRTMSDSFATEDRLRRELRNASRLRNPHIVEFRGAAWDHEDGPNSPRNVLLVTELMAGGNLRESLNCLQDDCGLSIESFVTIALQIARGIEYLHAEGLAHRDIKSANILLTERLPKYSNRFSSNVRAKIADFGLSKYIDKATGGGTVMQSIMEPGRLEATYAYLAPEAFGGDKSNVLRRDDDSDDDTGDRYDEMAKKRDIYALGVLFWEMLIGKIPWAGVSLPDVYVRVCVRSDRPTPSLDDSSVDRKFHRLIDRCWAQNPQRRPSARSIVAKLEKFAARYCVNDTTTAGSFSVVSGLAPGAPNSGKGMTELQADVAQKEAFDPGREVTLPSESLMMYHKMPSASTLRTVQNDDTKTQSMGGLDHSEGGLDRMVDDIPNQFDDTMWVEEAETHSASASGAPAPLSPPPARPKTPRSHGRASRDLTAGPIHNDVYEGATLNRRPTRPRPSGFDHTAVTGSTPSAATDCSLSRPTPAVAPVAVHSNIAHNQTTGTNSTPDTPVASVPKASERAVAATAAAIAAAKDRERKRDDLRNSRNAAPTTPTARVLRSTGNNTGSGVAPAGEVSNLQTYNSNGENWTRNVAKEKVERAVFYDNSDEEAQAFDPDRAAADEAIAESNNLDNATIQHQPSQQTTHPHPHRPIQTVQSSYQHQGQHHQTPQPARSATPVSGRISGLSLSHRPTPLGRVTGRPKSPVVRRPISPAVTRPYTPGGGPGGAPSALQTASVTARGEEETRATHSLSRTTELMNGGAVNVPKRSASSSRGRLARTLSASAQGENNDDEDESGGGGAPRSAATKPSNYVSSRSNQNVSSSMGSGLANLHTVASVPTHSTASTTPRNIAPVNSENTRGSGVPSAHALVTSSSTRDTNGRRAFIRRMRSNETSRRMARSSSSTGVENGRNKQTTPINGGVNGLSAVTVSTTKSTPSHISDALGSDMEMDDDHTCMVNTNSLNTKENFMAIVESVDKTDLMRLLGQRMQPLRLAALAHAALLSSKHRNDEEVLRNCCAYLHRLTVPTSSSSSGKTGGNGASHEVSPKEQLTIRKYLKNRQGVEALLQALHPPEVRHPTTLCYGLLALGNLTAWDLDAHKQFRNSHGVVQVTQVMKVHSQISGVQEKGCYALACVGTAYPAKSKYIFEQSGAIDVVIRALSEVDGEKSNDAVTKQACAAIGAMCSSCPANAVYAGRKEALMYLVASFDRFRKASKDGGWKRSEMRLVCKAFIDLLCHTENRKVAGAKGGTTMILRSIRIFRLESDFVQKGLTTLGQFCTLKSNCGQIVQHNGVDDIVGAMQRFPMVTGMQREACRVLALLMQATGDQARRRMVHAGGAEAVVFALERFGAIPETNDDVVLEACRALNMLFLMDNTVEGDILGRRMRKMRCDKVMKTAMMTHRQHAGIQEVAKDALRNLQALKGGGLWSRMRSGSKKWS